MVVQYDDVYRVMIEKRILFHILYSIMFQIKHLAAIFFVTWTVLCFHPCGLKAKQTSTELYCTLQTGNSTYATYISKWV